MKYKDIPEVTYRGDFMVMQVGNISGKTLVSIWLSKSENDDIILQEIITDLKTKYKVCTYKSGNVRSEEIYRKIVVDVAMK